MSKCVDCKFFTDISPLYIEPRCEFFDNKLKDISLPCEGCYYFAPVSYSTEYLKQKSTQITVNTEYNQSNKSDAGKTRLDLVFPSLIEGVGKVRTYGVQKYGDSDSWSKVEKERYVAAAMRHFEAWRKGEINDAESGLSHLAHCCCNLMFLIELDNRKE